MSTVIEKKYLKEKKKRKNGIKFNWYSPFLWPAGTCHQSCIERGASPVVKKASSFLPTTPPSTNQVVGSFYAKGWKQGGMFLCGAAPYTLSLGNRFQFSYQLQLTVNSVLRYPVGNSECHD